MPEGDRDDLDKVRSAVELHAYQVGVVLGLTRLDTPDRFSPTWTVYCVPPGRRHQRVAYGAVVMAQAEDVFDSEALVQLVLAADRADEARPHRTSPFTVAPPAGW